MSSFIMKTLLITTLIALSFAGYDFFYSGVNHPRRAKSSRRLQRKTGCWRAKCPNNEEYCINPKCYPHDEIAKVLHDRHDDIHQHKQHKSRSSGNCSKVLISEYHVFFFLDCYQSPLFVSILCLGLLNT